MTLVKSLYNFMDLNRKYFVLLVYTFFFLRHKFSDRKIVHGVLVTKSVAKRHHGTESPLVISGWIFFYCSRGEHVSVSSFENRNVFFSFLDSSSVGNPEPDPDPHDFWASRILIQIYRISQRYGSGSGSGSFPFLVTVLSGLK
jgi:hypothetical protein